MFMYVHRIPLLASIFLLTKWETIHTVFKLLFVVVLLVLNLTSCFFVHLLSCFKLSSTSLPFFSFILGYSSVLPVFQL